MVYMRGLFEARKSDYKGLSLIFRNRQLYIQVKQETDIIVSIISL